MSTLELRNKWKWLARDDVGTFFVFDNKPIFQDDCRWVCVEEYDYCCEIKDMPALFDVADTFINTPTKDALWRL